MNRFIEVEVNVYLQPCKTPLILKTMKFSKQQPDWPLEEVPPSMAAVALTLEQ